jgi:predicted adenine nucleotide alpha hydrolase (AANH) superfamily ATPase
LFTPPFWDERGERSGFYFMSFQKKLIPPENEKKILLHTCCAVCSGAIIEELTASSILPTLYYYNPNIHPREEYNIRKNESIRYAKKFGIPFVDADYDVYQWFSRTKGFEKEPERGKRCTICFDIRLEKTAEYAVKNGFRVFASSLGISRWKDIDQINSCGKKAGKRNNVIYWDWNWRKMGGSTRMFEIAKQEDMYQQKYCGCVYSSSTTQKYDKEQR